MQTIRYILNYCKIQSFNPCSEICCTDLYRIVPCILYLWDWKENFYLKTINMQSISSWKPLRIRRKILGKKELCLYAGSLLVEWQTYDILFFVFIFVFLAFLMIETTCEWTGICVGLQVIQIVLAKFKIFNQFGFHFPLSCILCHIMTERENKYWTGWEKFQLQDNSYHNIDNACPLHGRTKPVKDIFLLLFLDWVAKISKEN